jgi:hypothetical protein
MKIQTTITATALAALTLAAAPAGPGARAQAPLSYDAAVYCAAAFSGEALLASGPRKRELVERTGLAFRRAEDIARARGQPAQKVHDDFGAAGIALRREPKAAVEQLRALCLNSAAAPMPVAASATATPTCKAINALLAAAKEPTAFRSISAPPSGGMTPGRLVVPGTKSCSVYPGIRTYSCAVLDLPPAQGWALFYKQRADIEACVGKPLLYDFTRSGKGGMASLGAGEKPRVSAGVTELGGKAMVTVTVEGE